MTGHVVWNAFIAGGNTYLLYLIGCLVLRKAPWPSNKSWWFE